MKMISDGGLIINIRVVKFSQSEDYPRKTRKFVPTEISYPYGRYVKTVSVRTSLVSHSCGSGCGSGYYDNKAWQR